ncbi:MAG TPA: pectinesterase family protein [Chitinophagaceae bacterium]|nr:pectinesterase family protein [Chitinophagaceae bacterium]
MKIFLLTISFFLSVSNGFTQSKAGISSKPDTSYSIHSAYNSTVKTHPQTKIVKELKFATVAEERDLLYCTQGNRKLLTDVFFPREKTTAKRTAIIIIHGGGWRTGNKSIQHPMAKQLAAWGYVCFTPEYRLSTEALYPAAVFDIKSVIRWVRKNAAKYNIDESKISVAGHSAGGELAAMMGATNNLSSFEGSDCDKNFSSRVNAVINMDGILAFIHPESGEGDDNKRISAASNWFGFSKTENPGLWRQGSPLTHVGPHTPPTLFINSSVDRMHAGREEFIKILDQFKIYSAVKTFEGSPHSFPLFEPWFDSTIQVMDQFLKKVFDTPASAPVIIVAKDGSGNFTTVQSALDAVPLKNTRKQIIYIRNGVYKEKLFLDSTKNYVTVIGEDKFKTILTYDDHTGKISPQGDTISTRTSWSFKIRADNFTAGNITFQNDAGFTAGQAVAVESDGDKAIFKNCRFIGNQDVLFTNSDKSRQYYENCYIEGTTDFIFGSSTAWFEKCHIHSKKNSHITAASTPAEKKHGYVFNDCVLTGDTSLHNVSLGRPWRPYASVTYIRCFIGEHIKPEGWSNWNNTDNYKTTRYAEYKNYGPSSDPAKRIEWSKQLTDEEAKKITISKVLTGWNPLQ